MPNRFLQKVEGNLLLSGNQKAACEGQKSLGKSVHPEEVSALEFQDGLPAKKPDNRTRHPVGQYRARANVGEGLDALKEAQARKELLPGQCDLVPVRQDFVEKITEYCKLFS
jgi:hypothetical protein